MGSLVTNFSNYLKANERVHVSWCVTGIVGCLLLYGVLQVRFEPAARNARPGSPAFTMALKLACSPSVLFQSLQIPVSTSG